MTVRFGALVLRVMPSEAVLDAFRFAESIGLDDARAAEELASSYR